LPALPSNIPPVSAAKASWRDLFSGIYLSRTLAVWVMWFCTYLIVYGISGWLPTIYRTIFKLQLQQALQYSLAATAAGLVGALACAYLIDRTGRRAWFTMAFFLGAVPLFILWMRGAGNSAIDVMIYASVSYAMINTLALGLYLYTPEIYPTRVRAVGSAAATAWLRVASIDTRVTALELRGFAVGELPGLDALLDALLLVHVALNVGLHALRGGRVGIAPGCVALEPVDLAAFLVLRALDARFLCRAERAVLGGVRFHALDARFAPLEPRRFAGVERSAFQPLLD